MKFTTVMRVLVLSAFVLGLAGAHAPSSCGCDLCEKQTLPVPIPRFVPAPQHHGYRTVVREYQPAAPAPCDSGRSYEVGPPQYFRADPPAYAPAPKPEPAPCDSDRSYEVGPPTYFKRGPPAPASYDSGRSYEVGPPTYFKRGPPAPVPAPCDSSPSYEVGPPTYFKADPPAPAPAPCNSCGSPSCGGTYSSCKTKNVVEVVKTLEPRYIKTMKPTFRIRNRPVTVCSTCRQPAPSCGCQ